MQYGFAELRFIGQPAPVSRNYMGQRLRSLNEVAKKLPL
jgi:hypothetical protein